MSASDGASSDVKSKRPGGEKFVIYWKPFWLTYGLLPLAVIALFGQIWLRPLDVLLGGPFGQYLTIARVILVLLGFVLLLIALPVIRPAGWSPDQDDAEDTP